MQQTFLVIISAIGAGYALLTKQFRLSFGLLILGFSFVLMIPSIASGLGVRTDIFGALSMIVFLGGVIIMVYKKREKPVDEKEEISKSIND